MKTLDGVVVSLKMANTAVVEVTWRYPHPLYRKLIKKSKKYKADTSGMELVLGQNVRILETRPISKDKHFKVVKVIKKGEKDGSA